MRHQEKCTPTNIIICCPSKDGTGTICEVAVCKPIELLLFNEHH